MDATIDPAPGSAPAALSQEQLSAKAAQERGLSEALLMERERDEINDRLRAKAIGLMALAFEIHPFLLSVTLVCYDDPYQREVEAEVIGPSGRPTDIGIPCFGFGPHWRYGEGDAGLDEDARAISRASVREAWDAVHRAAQLFLNAGGDGRWRSVTRGSEPMSALEIARQWKVMELAPMIESHELAWATREARPKKPARRSI